MDYNKEELEIIRIILDIEDNIAIKNVFLKIVDILKEKKKIKYTYENNKYVFKDKKSIEKLRLISDVIEELINNNLIKVSKSKEKKLLNFINSNGKKINDFMLIKLEEISDCYFYKTPRLRKIFSNFILTIILFILIYSLYFWSAIPMICEQLKYISFISTSILKWISIFLKVIGLAPLISIIDKNTLKNLKYPYFRSSFYSKDIQIWLLILSFFTFFLTFASFLVTLINYLKGKV